MQMLRDTENLTTVSFDGDCGLLVFEQLPFLNVGIKLNLLRDGTYVEGTPKEIRSYLKEVCKELKKLE